MSIPKRRTPDTVWGDPIGPGTSAWNAFDAALEAYANCKGIHDERINAEYKRYSNQRSYMIQRLRAHNTPPDVIAQWCALLRQRIASQEWE